MHYCQQILSDSASKEREDAAEKQLQGEQHDIFWICEGVYGILWKQDTLSIVPDSVQSILCTAGVKKCSGFQVSIFDFANGNSPTNDNMKVRVTKSVRHPISVCYIKQCMYAESILGRSQAAGTDCSGYQLPAWTSKLHSCLHFPPSGHV